MLATSDIAIRLLLAAALGAVIGFDRERNAWAAGLRTHMLVCLGAALAMIVSAFAFSDILAQRDDIVLDPSRIAAQVISGIGFLGAGTIMFLHRESVIRGLTTAAGLWTVAAIGLAVGGGLFAAAAIATAVAWAILALVKQLERRYSVRRARPVVRLVFSARAALAAIGTLLAAPALPECTLTVRATAGGGDEVSIEFLAAFERARLSELADALRGLPGVTVVALDPMSTGA